MTSYHWLVCDTAQSVFVEDLVIGKSVVPESISEWEVKVRTLRGGRCNGVDLIEVVNGAFSFIVLPTRGMSIWRGRFNEREIGWKSPVHGPVHPHFVPLESSDGLGWLEGFDEMLVRCGLYSNGAPEFNEIGQLVHPLHGRIGNLPAQRVEIGFDVESQTISICGVVEECRFFSHHLRLTTKLSARLGKPSMSIHDEVTNCSGRPTTTQLLYHINFGLTLLNHGSQLVAPVKTVVPRTRSTGRSVHSWATYGAEKSDFEEEVFFLEMNANSKGQTEVLLKNAASDFGVSLIYNIRQLPCFTQWKYLVAEEDGRVTGLEPGTNFPNRRSFEAQHGRVVRLEPNQKATYDLELSVCEGASEVMDAIDRIQTLQSEVTPLICDVPRADWCIPC